MHLKPAHFPSGVLACEAFSFLPLSHASEPDGSLFHRQSRFRGEVASPLMLHIVRGSVKSHHERNSRSTRVLVSWSVRLPSERVPGRPGSAHSITSVIGEDETGASLVRGCPWVVVNLTPTNGQLDTVKTYDAAHGLCLQPQPFLPFFSPFAALSLFLQAPF